VLYEVGDSRNLRLLLPRDAPESEVIMLSRLAARCRVFSL